MIGKRLIMGAIAVLVLLSVGAFFLLNSFAPLEKKDVLLNDAFSVAGNTYEKRGAWISSSGEYIASFNVSEGAINFTSMHSSTFSMWLEGQFQPSWYESDTGRLGMSFSMEEGTASLMYFVFVNNDTATKEVQLEVSKSWKETNYAGLLEGAVLVLSGTIMAIVLKYWHEP